MSDPNAGSSTGSTGGARKAPTVYLTPYTVVIDDREKQPYVFANHLQRDRRAYQISTTRGRLATGDYSILGHEANLAIERKSLADLFGTLGQGRARFVRELERLQEIEMSLVVVEAEFGTILSHPPARSQLNPLTVVFSVLAWTVRYPRVRWFFVPSREFGEVTTALLLDWYYRERIAGAADKS